MNICLKFTDEAQAKSILYTEHPAALDADGNSLTEAYSTPNFCNIDIIGQSSKLTGETDVNGEPVMITLDGWHVNVFLLPEEDITTLESFIVTPLTPSRVWA